uniref:AB hydrolase-1 domain-containing protein n=1 Tax=Picea sitchensis TaxID=3332 RepID=D5A834_PICSI|nr:unknown [Picea sitchensis]
MAGYCFSLISFWTKRLQKAFVSAGLESKLIDVDDSTTIHCWAPKKCDTHKQNVVLIHGFGTNAMWQWYPQIQPFVGSFNVYVPDLVFFGDSTTRSSERSEIFQAESLMKMLKRLGVSKFSVVGTSYGGFVAYTLAYLYPEAVDKVVIASSAVCKHVEDNTELLKRANLPKISDVLLPQSPASLRILTRLSVYKPPLTMLPNFILNDFIQILYVENRAEKIELLAGLTLGTEGAAVPVINKDVLIVWGEHDQIFPMDKAFQLKKHLRDQAELVVMKNASHIPHIENPQEFNAVVKNFLLHHSSSIS